MIPSGAHAGPPGKEYLMSNTGEQLAAQKKLVERMRQCGESLSAFLTQRSDRFERRMMIFIGFVAKTIKMLRSLSLEADSASPENCLIPARVLLETWVNFMFFADEFTKDEEGAVTRFWEALPLQMGKLFRAASAHKGLGEISGDLRLAADDFRKAMLDRDGKEATRAVESHGFYGMNIEGRCKQVGKQPLYDLLYRQLCSPVHASDILQSAVDVLTPEVGAEIYSLFIPAALAVGLDAGRSVFGVVNGVVNGPAGTEIDKIAEEAKSLRPEVPVG
jgi:hypothetical protein